VKKSKEKRRTVGQAKGVTIKRKVFSQGFGCQKKSTLEKESRKFT